MAKKTSVRRKRKRDEVDEDCGGGDVKRAKKAGKIRRDKDGLPTVHVALTGAHEGDMLAGIHDDSKDALFKVVRGTICSVPCFTRNVEDREMVRAISKAYNISHDVAEQRIRMFPVPEDDQRDNAQPLGSSCRHRHDDASCECEPEAFLQILQPGALQSHADIAGQGAQMEEAVRTQRVVSWRDILQMMGRKTLVLRPRLYKVVVGPKPMTAQEFEAIRKEVCPIPTEDMMSKAEFADSSVFLFNDKVMVVPKSAAESITHDQVAEVTLAALGMKKNDRWKPALCELVAVCRKFSLGVLKSMLQKAARYGAQNVLVEQDVTGLDHDIALPVQIFSAVVSCTMFACKGMFSPELQLFTRGCTAVFKRLAVIMVEDAWPTRGERDKVRWLAALLGYALISQRMTQWIPPLSVVKDTIRLSALMARSRSMLKWHERKLDKHVIRGGMEVSAEHIELWRMCAEMLAMVKSFQSDIAMFEKLARIAEQQEMIPTLTMASADAPPLMPMCHGVDHHAFRGIGHIINPIMSHRGFKACFSRIFDEVTGQNPRIQYFHKCIDEEEFEKRWNVRALRYAQKEILRLLLCKAERRVLPARSNEGGEDGDSDGGGDDALSTFSLSIDPGTLSASVAPIPISLPTTGLGKTRVRGQKVLVILGVGTPEEEVVMLPPTQRNPKDLYGGVSDEQAQKAIAMARDGTYKITSPFFGRQCLVAFDKKRKRWCINGTPWVDVCANDVEYIVPIHPDPHWANNEITTSILDDDDALSECLAWVGSGACESADELIVTLRDTVKKSVVQRARSMLVQQYERVAMPVPNLRGGQHSDQLMAYDGDWHVFRFLALVSRIYPGALRVESVPCFSVPNAALLRHVQNMLCTDEALVRDREGDEDEDEWEHTKWGLDERWKRMDRVYTSGLMEHQLYAVTRMEERDRKFSVPGHFLVMDTGLGKTHTSLSYFYRRLANTSLGHRASYFVWVAPKSTVEDMVLSIAKTTGEAESEQLPVHFVPRPKAGDAKVQFHKYHVNVVDSDHMRVMIKLDLLSLASECVVVFDEVDTMYEATQRTSACRQLAKTCAAFVAQTATPMSKNEAHLAAWLADTESYPVHKGNYLVAASGMVSLQISLSIAMEDRVESVPLSSVIRTAIMAYPLDDEANKWLIMARRTQRYTDKRMCEVAVKIVAKDTRKYASGGVLMVADNATHAERLVRLMGELGVASGLFDEISNDAVQCVVVTKKQDRGYNGGTRFRAIVKGVYAGNGASRHQMRGRIRRIGQKRRKVLYVTVVMENTILELLYKRQQHADTLNISLQELAREFEESVLNKFVTD